MKMFLFNPNDYDLQFFVVANDKIEAHKYLLNHFKKLSKSSDSFNRKYYKGYYDKWLKVDPMNPDTFPEKYTLLEYAVGEVVESEIS